MQAQGHRNYGAVRPGAVTLVERVDDVATLAVPDAPLSYVTQTTLSVDDTKDIDALVARFQTLKRPTAKIFVTPPTVRMPSSTSAKTATSS